MSVLSWKTRDESLRNRDRSIHVRSEKGGSRTGDRQSSQEEAGLLERRF